MAGRLDGKIALVTGGSGGIGAETCRRFAAEGADVCVHYGRNGEAAAAVAQSVEALGGRGMAVGGDVATDAERIVAHVASAWGRIDILVNNAGVSLMQPFGSVTPEAFAQEFNTNVLGVILMMQAAAPHFPETGGRIVNVGSNLTSGPLPGLSVYAASKAAVSCLTQGFARELGGRNITVNAVAPGATVTNMTAWIPDDVRQGIARSTPLGRMAQPDDVADAILFLASDEARWVTGRTVIVDGGLI
jgi:3-oxoacyl-[acyl-carrier protein] reductase